MPSYWLIPWSLVVLSLVLVGIIIWGGFVEERRNGRSAPTVREDEPLRPLVGSRLVE